MRLGGVAGSGRGAGAAVGRTPGRHQGRAANRGDPDALRPPTLSPARPSRGSPSRATPTADDARRRHGTGPSTRPARANEPRAPSRVRREGAPEGGTRTAVGGHGDPARAGFSLSPLRPRGRRRRPPSLFPGRVPPLPPATQRVDRAGPAGGGGRGGRGRTGGRTSPGLRLGGRRTPAGPAREPPAARPEGPAGTHGGD